MVQTVAQKALEGRGGLWSQGPEEVAAAARVGVDAAAAALVEALDGRLDGRVRVEVAAAVVRLLAVRAGGTAKVGVRELKLLPDGDLGMKRKELCVHCVAYTHAT